jgi:hypothetical protein
MLQKQHYNSLSILFSIFSSWVPHHFRWPYFRSEVLLAICVFQFSYAVVKLYILDELSICN